MAKVEELFGSGDLLGVEVSIESGTGKIVIYSDELSLSQRTRIEEALGEVTYYQDISEGRQPPEAPVIDDTFPERPTIAIYDINISPDRQKLVLRFSGNCEPNFKGWARVDGDALEVAVTQLGLSPACFAIMFEGEVEVVLDEPFNGTEIRDLASDYVLRLEPPDA